MDHQSATETSDAATDDGFEWAIVEIFGHRQHAGRTREEERFGAKMLRVDVPKLEWNGEEDGKRRAAVTGWATHYYGGSAIFSFSLTDEATVMKANRPYDPPARLTYSAHEDDDAETF
jgi:hypothetical protein